MIKLQVFISTYSLRIVLESVKKKKTVPVFCERETKN